MDHPCKPLFANRPMIEDLIRGFIAAPGDDWVDRLQFDHMVRVPEDWVAPRWRCADLIWSIPLQAIDGGCPATHMIVILKFVSDVVADMATRIGRQVDLLRLELDRREAFGAPDNPPLLVPVVVYTGEQPWTAPMQEEDVARH